MTDFFRGRQKPFQNGSTLKGNYCSKSSEFFGRYTVKLSGNSLGQEKRYDGA